MSQKIFIIEDEPDILLLLEDILTREGFKVYKYQSGLEALNDIKIKKPDLVLLDLMLPDTSGLQITREIKESSSTSHIPIIILSSRSDEYDIINSYSFGCSDYITKPFNEKILVAKIRVHLSCIQLPEEECNGCIKIEELLVDPERYEVSIRNKLIDLTPHEFKLFYFLARNKGKVLSRNRIYDEIYEDPDFRSDRAIDILVNRIRKKLRSYGKRIETVYGVGYSFK